MLDFSDGASVDLVPLHCHRHPGIRPLAQGRCRFDDDRHGEACWEAIDDAAPGESAILVGCSVGSSIAPYMYHQRPDKTAALVLSGTGYNPTKEFTKGRIENYTANGIDYRWAYTFEDLSAAFRTTPLAHFFANLFTERNQHADVQTIIHQFKALAQPYPEGHHESIACPTIILTGSEDGSHQTRLRASGAHTQLRVEDFAGSRPRLSDRAALAIRSLHDRISHQARPVSRSIQAVPRRLSRAMRGS